VVTESERIRFSFSLVFRTSRMTRQTMVAFNLLLPQIAGVHNAVALDSLMLSS